MAKIEWKPGTLLAPVPVVLVSCGSIEQPNVLTVAWTGILSSEPPKTYVSVRPSRHSHALIKETGEFVINLPSSYLIRIVDFCGVKSGRDMQKFDVCNLTAAPSVKVGAPPSHARLEPPSSIIENTSRQTMIVAERWLCSTSSTAAGASIRMKGRMP